MSQEKCWSKLARTSSAGWCTLEDGHPGGCEGQDIMQDRVRYTDSDIARLDISSDETLRILNYMSCYMAHSFSCSRSRWHTLTVNAVQGEIVVCSASGRMGLLLGLSNAPGWAWVWIEHGRFAGTHLPTYIGLYPMATLRGIEHAEQRECPPWTFLNERTK